jgi:hypothetical protein
MLLLELAAVRFTTEQASAPGQRLGPRRRVAPAVRDAGHRAPAIPAAAP